MFKKITQLVTYQSLVDSEFGYGRQLREQQMITAWRIKIAELRVMPRFGRLSRTIWTR